MHGDSEYEQPAYPAAEYPELDKRDLKLKDYKYRRWLPKMDQFLVKLLSDVVHLYRRGEPPRMLKAAWGYVCGQLRAANPQTVYLTYTRYLLSQHLLNVIHHRYKVWYVLMIHTKLAEAAALPRYRYAWLATKGRFEVFLPQGVIKSPEEVSTIVNLRIILLPLLELFSKQSQVLNDFFETDNLRYMLVYHNEVLPLLIEHNPKFGEGLGDIYLAVGKFAYYEAGLEWDRPLHNPKKPDKKAAKPRKLVRSVLGPVPLNPEMHMTPPDYFPDFQTPGSEGLSPEKRSDYRQPPRMPIVPHPPPQIPVPLQKTPSAPEFVATVNSVTTPVRKGPTLPPDSASQALVDALLAAAQLPLVLPPLGPPVPIYVKDRVWFDRLLQLSRSDLLTADEVLQVSAGVRDRKIPLFMLNVLDRNYHPVANKPDEMPDTEVAKRVREFMLPMLTYDR